MQEQEQILIEDEDEMEDLIDPNDEEPNDLELDEIHEEDYDIDPLEFLNDEKIPVSDSFKIYLSQIQNYSLLNKDQEIELFKRYGAGDLTARDEIINHNLRLVIAIALKLNFYRTSILDLIQAGNEGLMIATDRFDYKKGFKFSTYATWWIKQAVYRSLANEDKTIRLPVHLVDFNCKLTKARQALMQNFSRDPTIDEYYDYFEHRHSKEKIEKGLLQLTNASLISLDSPLSSDSNATLLEVVDVHGQSDNVKKYLDNEDKREAVKELLEECCKTKRDRRIISLLYGLEDGVEHTLDDTAQIIYDEHYDAKRVTRERIRQIESKFLDRVRNSPSRLAKLRDLMDNN